MPRRSTKSRGRLPHDDHTDSESDNEAVLVPNPVGRRRRERQLTTQRYLVVVLLLVIDGLLIVLLICQGSLTAKKS